MLLFGRIGLWAAFWVLRHLPVLGIRLADSYGAYVFAEDDERVEVTELDAGFEDEDPPSLRLDLRVENDSRFDVRTTGIDLRIGLTESGATVRNVTWAPAFEEAPRNVETELVRSGEAGDIGVELYEPALTRESTTVWVDGTVVAQYSFEFRGHRLSFTDRNSRIPSNSVELEIDDEGIAHEAEAGAETEAEAETGAEAGAEAEAETETEAEA
jgi:hypothetical protein